MLNNMGLTQDKLLQMADDPKVQEAYREMQYKKQQFLNRPAVKELLRNKMSSFIKGRYPNIPQELLDKILNSREMNNIYLDSFGIGEKGEIIISGEITEYLFDRFEKEGPFKDEFKSCEESIDESDFVSGTIDLSSQENRSTNNEIYGNVKPNSETSDAYPYNESYYNYRNQKNHIDYTKDDRELLDSELKKQIEEQGIDFSTNNIQRSEYMNDMSMASSYESGSIDLFGKNYTTISSMDTLLRSYNSFDFDPDYHPPAQESPITTQESHSVLESKEEEMIVGDIPNRDNSHELGTEEIPLDNDDNSAVSSDSSSTSSNNTGMIVSEDKSAATVGGFWSNFMRHMREDKESKGFFGKIRSAFRKAREDRDKELGFAMDEPTEVSHSESPVEEPTFDDRYKVDMSGKSTPIVPQPEKSTTDTKQQNPEEPTQDTDEPLI